MHELLIATSNPGKFREIVSRLEGSFPSVRFRSLSEFQNIPSVQEDGQSFLENAQKKAKAMTEAFDLISLADDSGLEVDALNGKPGIHSARYAGVNASDQDNIQKLLNELKDVPESQRNARFQCVMVVWHPNEQSLTAQGTLEGHILTQCRGTFGFGYDPIFYVPKLGKTLAEIPLLEKNRLSHRAITLDKLSTQLTNFLS